VSLYTYKRRAAGRRLRVVKMGGFRGRAGAFHDSNNRLGVAVSDMVKWSKCGAVMGVFCDPVQTRHGRTP
jgi:hypothetical protein